MLHLTDDIPIWEDNYKVLTREQLKIPGLHMMGHAHFHETYKELDNHFHTTMEFVVVINGRQEYVVDGKRYMLYGNEMFATYPLEQHGNGEKPQERCEFIWFQFDLSSSQNFLGLTSPRSDYLFRQMLNYRKRICKIDMNDTSVLQRAFKLFSSEDFSQQILGYGLFLEFLLKNICMPDNEMKEKYSEDIEDAISFIHKNLFKDINIEIIAENCGLSAPRFKAKFKEQIGVTPHYYINALKIDSAKIYLKDEDRSITEIAYLLNFSSSNHFASVFKKYTGYTPTEFRKHKFSYIY